MRESDDQRMTEITNADAEERDDHDDEEEELEGEEEEEEIEEEEEEIEEEVEEEIEVEVEEEIEVEEEVEVEAEVEEQEEGEQQKNSNEDSHQFNLAHQNQSDDASQDMEIEEDDEIIELHPAPEKSDLRLPFCSLVSNSAHSYNDSGASNGSLEKQGNVCVNDKDTKFPIVENYLITAEQNGNLASTSYTKDTETSNKEKYKECDEPNGDKEACSCINVPSAEMINACYTKEKDSDVNLPMGESLVQKVNNFLHSKDELQPISVQSEDRDLKLSRTRGLSPSAKIQDRSKRSARVCDFFAKGWCIKGSSCTFLHVKDKSNNSDQQLEGDGTNLTREDRFDEGLGNIMKKSKTSGLLNKKGSSVEKDDVLSCHLSFGRALMLENEENERPRLLKDKQKILSLHRLDLSRHFYGGNLSSHSSSLIYLNGNQDQLQGNPSLDASVLSSGMLASQRISNWTGSFCSFHPSMNTSPLGSQKLHNDRDFCVPRSSSLLQYASPLSVSDRQSKTKISPNDWELSVPFRPSFVIAPATCSPSGQYDPFRDCIDLPSLGNKSFKFYFLSQGTSSMNESHKPLHGDDRSSGSFYDKVHENAKDKVCHTPGKASFTSGIEGGPDCVVDGQNWVTPAEENASGTDHVKDASNKNEFSFVGDTWDRINFSKKEAKGNRIKQNNDIEVDQKMDESMQKEPKALRCFRGALIEFVKELLKPVWREGYLSKDAHNTIVKKAVEKVVSTMQHQIPDTLELTKLYLSSSQPKIAKLVEAYLEKYGQS